MGLTGWVGWRQDGISKTSWVRWHGLDELGGMAWAQQIGLDGQEGLGLTSWVRWVE